MKFGYLQPFQQADWVDDADGMMGVRHPLTSTGAVRICTGKTE